MIYICLMQNSYYLFLLLPFLPMGLAAQVDTLIAEPLDTAATIDYVAYWSVGDKFVYAVEKHKLEFRADSLTKSDTTRYRGVFEVIDSTAERYTVSWQIEGYHRTGESPSDYAAIATPDQSLAMDVVDAIVFTTDEVGAFERITNLEEIRRAMDTVFSMVMVKEIASAPPEKQASIRNMFDKFRVAITSDAYLVTKVFAEIQHLLYPMGVSFPVGEEIEYEDTYPNTFGGDPIRANALLRFDSIDVNDDYAHLVQYVQADPIDVVNMISDVFKTLGLPESERQEFMENSDMDMWEENDYHHYYYPGIPIYVDCMRVVDMTIAGQAGRKVERILLEWVE